MKRVPQHEILDGDSIPEAEALRSLRDLRMVNQLFGGVSTTAFLLRQAMRRAGLQRASVLEVAAGDGYSIARAAKQLEKDNLQVELVCLDRRPLQAQPHGCERVIAGDALALPFPAASFDFVSCGLFLHHLAPAQLVTFVDGALHAARHAVLMNDLRRSLLHLALVYTWMPIFRSPVSRLDGAASVRQAYTPEELRELIRQSNAKSLEMKSRFLFRMAAIAWK